MKRTSILLGLAITALGLLGSTPCSAQEPAREPAASPRSGFAVHLASSVAVPQADEPAAFEGRLSAGYSTHRLFANVGIEVAHARHFETGPGWTGPFYDPKFSIDQYDSYVWLVSPELQVTLVELAADRLALFAAASVGFGQHIQRAFARPWYNDVHVWASDATGVRMGCRLGLGVRWWATSTFGVDALAGVAGGLSTGVHRRKEYFVDSSNEPTLTQEEEVPDRWSPLSIFAGVGLVRVF